MEKSLDFMENKRRMENQGQRKIILSAVKKLKISSYINI